MPRYLSGAIVALRAHVFIVSMSGWMDGSMCVCGWVDTYAHMSSRMVSHVYIP